MEKNLKEIDLKYIQNKIYTTQNQQIMIDSDLAELYGVETRVLNQAVKRNIARFPDKFRFQLSQQEAISLKSQNVIIENKDDSLRSQIATA
ncbi:MAG: hypothetical protein APR54_05500 [Candidatus Cloacimonas sp. SDB]|nr:MAG: hypothetical protein APR54_05500 [Candidatus Cloacimonas sp. SDB]